MCSFGFMKAALKCKKQANHSISLPEVLNIDDSAIERRTVHPKRVAVLICPIFVLSMLDIP